MNPTSSYVTPSFAKMQNQEMIPNKKNLNKDDTKHLLYFSNYCKHSKTLLEEMNSKSLLDKVELLCIDNRYIKDNITYISVQNNQYMPLPPMINSVPTLCILPNHEILKGNEIVHYFLPISKTIHEERNQVNLEPNPFSIGGECNSAHGVYSDNFSFWDTDQKELSASGNGGTKQMYNYVSVHEPNDEQIYTPQEETNDKKNINLEELQQQRQNEI
jgi:hypothetical protein